MVFFIISLGLIVTRVVITFNTWYKVETVDDNIFKCGTCITMQAQTGRTNLAVRPPCSYKW